ncbi:MAG: protein kinase [Thermoanaerobaculia bacterium]
MTLAAGIRLGPYEILAPLGAGGMGEVYRAKDTRLGREVAIKVLPASFSQDADRLRRFEQEARAASALSHPNILTVHDVGTHEKSPYVVTELLEGQTLREQIDRGPLGLRRALEIATALAHGLAAAHEKGIVHRDIKPENLFVTRDGRLKILDFGLARVVSPEDSDSSLPTATHTRTGTVLGTASYMSPEQARGQPADARSDIFSFGVVFYEMLSGRRPFAGGSPIETLNAILRDEPPPLEGPAGGLPPALERLVGRCLEKSRELRFQNARDLAFALESAEAPRADFSSPGRPRTRRSIAVLLFKDLAGDPANAHLGLGLADATITELASMKSLLVRPTAAILRYRGSSIDPEQAGHELGVDAVVDGNFQRSGSRLRVTVQLIETADGRPLWGTKIDTSLDDLFAMQDEVSRKIAAALEVELSPAEERRPGGPPSGKAFELYLKGRLHLSADTTFPEVNAAIECFERALEIDAGFALAQLGLADAFARMAFSIDPEGDWYERAQTMCQRALTEAPDLPEGRYLKGRLLWHPRSGWNADAAMREFSAAIAGRPNLNEAHHFLAQLLNHLGLLEEAVRSFDRALAIDPEDHYAHIHRAFARYLQGRFDGALGALQARSAKTPTPSDWVFYQVTLCQLHLGHARDADATIERLSRQFPGSILVAPLRGLVAGMEGDATRAREQIELVVRNRKLFGHYHHAQYDVACIEAFLGEKQRALDWLAEAAGNGFPCASFFEIDPWLEPLRGEARFRELIADLQVEREAHRRLYGELTSAIS